MTEPTQEQLRTEAYWRSTIARELYAEAEHIERTFQTRALGAAVSAIVSHVGNKVGQMPDRTPPAHVAADATRILAGPLHVTRGPGPGKLEADCPCPKEPCGAVDTTRTDPGCDQHPASRSKTMRNIHRADQCRGA